MKDRKTMVLTVIAIVTLSLLVIAATFAYFQAMNSASGSTTVTTQNETIGSVIVTNPTESLYLKLSAYDMQENKKNTSYYATPLKNTEGSTYSTGKVNNVISNYEISGGADDTVYSCSYKLSVVAPSNIQKGDMTLELTGIGSKIEGLSTLSIDLAETKNKYTVTFSRIGNGSGNLLAGDIIFNNTNKDQSYLAGQNINASISLTGLNCVIEKIEGPDLYDDTLTPVIYDGDNWKIVESNDEDWYDYTNQEWANAVILKSDSDKGVGDTLSVEGSDPDVLAMYVWIPRYEYRIQGKYGLGGTSASSPGEIEVNFISKSIIEPSDGYIIHPAFTIGAEELSGIWVGKFEMGHSSSSTLTLGCVSESCGEANNLRILPDQPSLRSNSTSSFFYSIKSMEQDGNVFGINKGTTDSHMMKNSEWGAVAYLSQSQFGKYGNDDYSGANKEIYMNNSSSYYTGRSGGSYPGNVSTNTYGTYTYDGYLLNENTKTTTKEMNKIASTTGNITGIYDMSGGSWEYTMGVFANSDGELYSGYDKYDSNSGFSGRVYVDNLEYVGVDFPNSKYYDKYTAYSGTTIDQYTSCNGGPCYGHALGETSGWNGNYTNMVKASGPWAARSGSYSDGGSAGIFGIAATKGNKTTMSTRAVLTSKSSVTKEYETYDNGEIVYFDVESGKKCTNYNIENSKTGYNGIDNRTGSQNSCLKFYAFNDNGGNTINLLLDHNTTATSKWNTTGESTDGPITTLGLLKNDTEDWKGTIEPSNYTTGVEGRRYTVNYDGMNARLITSNEIGRIVGYTGWNENKSVTNITFYFDSRINTQSSTCKEGNTTECKFGWLYDRTDLSCDYEGCYNNADVETSGYWTASSSAVTSTTEAHQVCGGNVIYGVSHHGKQGYTCPQQEGHYGIRPVIEVLKDDLQNKNNSICQLADDSEVAEGEYGAKYVCKVNPNKPEYTFYLMDNNDDGTSDLIMSHNINASGEEVIPEVSSDLGLIECAPGKVICEAYYETNYDNRYGPVSAMTYLYNATKNWTNVSPVNFEYRDKEVQGGEYGYTSFKSVDGISVITASDGSTTTIGSESKPLRTRMPVIVRGINSTYSHLNEISYGAINFLANLSSDPYEGNGPFGYWTLSSDVYTYRTYLGVYVNSGGLGTNGFLRGGDTWYVGGGVRPVITVKLK